MPSISAPEIARQHLLVVAQRLPDARRRSGRAARTRVPKPAMNNAVVPSTRFVSAPVPSSRTAMSRPVTIER